MIPRRRGLLGRRLPDRRSFWLYDGPSLSFSDGREWTEPSLSLPSGLPRQPTGLAFLDLVRPESVLDVIEDGRFVVRGEPTIHYTLKLDVDQIDWPDLPDALLEDMRSHLRPGRSLPDLRPTGVLSAEAWIDEAERVRRFSHLTWPALHRDASWIATELWDFGGPPSIGDWKTQPVIDPVTLDLPERAPA
jgi:hypothetical protein